MVLLISQQQEASTDKVIDWLYFLKKTFYRINGEDIIFNNSLITAELAPKGNIVSFKKSDNDYINSDEISSIWYRRVSFASFSPKILPEIDRENFYTDVVRNLFNEYSYGRNAFFVCLEKGKKKLGNFRNNSLDKIEVLIKAKEHGIDIPATIITNSKADLKVFFKQKRCIITKAINENFDIAKKNESSLEEFRNYTEEITENTLKKIPNYFYLSLFQEKLDKEIEIRTFFIDRKCYSMAIFSQLDCQTSVDFRKYNNNRNIPYLLPKKLEDKINKLMKDINLDTGSLDIVKTKDGRFVFLEVNPFGQYDMVSVPCNYHLDKKIAEYLASV